ncbi:MAG: PadR family transcriptional regulator [Oscillospiraceae bacterium]|jgi:PadR family transcriptional regulator PadR
MIGSDVIRGYNDTIILSLLLEHDSYGYEISKQIREITGERYVMKETTLYSAFTRLEKNGFIASYLGSETFGRQRTYYRVTQAGKDYYREKCLEWQETKEVVSKFIKEAD